MQMKLITTLFLATIIASSAFSQDKLYMMNGGVFDVKVNDTSNAKILVDFTKHDKIKKITLDKEDVFSIKYASGQEVIFYKEDSLSEENYMTVSEMSDYVAGQRDATKGYHSPGTTISSVVVGAASGLTGGFLFIPLLSPVPSGLFVGAAGARWIKIKRKNVSDTKYLKSDTYVLGYDHAARGKRLQNAIIGTGSGLIAGIISAIIFKPFK